MAIRSLIKELKSSSGEKKSIFNICCWFIWWSVCRRMQIDLFLSPCTKPKSKCIKDLRIKKKYTESNGREIREEPQTHRHMGKFPEQNTNILCSKITNRLMGPHKTTVNRTNSSQHIWKRCLCITQHIER